MKSSAFLDQLRVASASASGAMTRQHSLMIGRGIEPTVRLMHSQPDCSRVADLFKIPALSKMLARDIPADPVRTPSTLRYT